MADQALDVADTVGGVRGQVDALLGAFADDEGQVELEQVRAENAPVAPVRNLDPDTKVMLMVAGFVALAVLLSRTKERAK